MKIGYIGQEVEIPDPEGFAITPIEISKSERTASGRMVKDIIAVKRKFSLRYDALDPADVNIFVSFYEIGRTVNFIYEDSGRTVSAIVYITDLPRELFVHDFRYSENINITLEEQ
jgi:hypothetical protein